MERFGAVFSFIYGERRTSNTVRVRLSQYKLSDTGQREVALLIYRLSNPGYRVLSLPLLLGLLGGSLRHGNKRGWVPPVLGG